MNIHPTARTTEPVLLKRSVGAVRTMIVEELVTGVGGKKITFVVHVHKTPQKSFRKHVLWHMLQEPEKKMLVFQLEQHKAAYRLLSGCCGSMVSASPPLRENDPNDQFRAHCVKCGTFSPLLDVALWKAHNFAESDLFRGTLTNKGEEFVEMMFALLKAWDLYQADLFTEVMDKESLVSLFREANELKMR